MAYKYAKGKVYRGDIYNEDDAQKNTYLDWNEDAVGIVAGGTTVLAVSGASGGLTARVGIGTSSPASTLDVVGSIGGSIDTVTGTSNSLGDSHFTVLMDATAGNCAAQLPDVTICTGRIYTFKRVDSSGNAVKVQSNGSDEIDGTTDDLELSNQYQAYTLQSDGARWWIITDRNV
jgi:hypothetical protein